MILVFAFCSREPRATDIACLFFYSDSSYRIIYLSGDRHFKNPHFFDFFRDPAISFFGHPLDYSVFFCLDMCSFTVKTWTSVLQLGRFVILVYPCRTPPRWIIPLELRKR